MILMITITIKIMIITIVTMVIVEIYTTKIEEFVCPPNIFETVAVRTMKLAHRPRIAPITIKRISKQIFLPIV